MWNKLLLMVLPLSLGSLLYVTHKVDPSVTNSLGIILFMNAILISGLLMKIVLVED